MSNLSDLLPAGGGAKVITATADGNLATGQTVILQSNGTVKAVEATAAGFGSAAVFEAASTSYSVVVYDSYNDKIVVFYSDAGDSNKGKAVVGTVTGYSISWGTAVQFSDGNDVSYIGGTYDPDTYKVIVVYKDGANNNYGTANDGTVSGTSISFGANVVYESDSVFWNAATYETAADKVVVAYRDAGYSKKGKAIVGTVSGTSISFGSATDIDGGEANRIGITFDSTNNKVLIIYEGTGIEIISGTVSGTSISFGVSGQLDSSSTNQYIGIAYSPTDDKFVAAWHDSGSSGILRIQAGSTSGSGFAVGSAATVSGTNASYPSIAYDSSSGIFNVAYQDQNDSSKGYVVPVTLSGFNATTSTPQVFGTAANDYIWAAYNSSAKNTAIVYKDQGNSNYGTGIIWANAGTTSDNFVGITNQAINHSASGEVVVEGGVITNASLLPLTYSASLGSEAMFLSNRRIEYTAVTYDTTNDKVIVAYADPDSGSGVGMAAVGTVSGTSISWGTPVQFSSSRPYYIGAAFEATEGKVVLAYRDSGNSNYGYSVVGTVSGTSISFGTPVEWMGAATVDMAVVAIGSSKVVVLGNNNSELYGKVGTVSGTSISFGSAAAGFGDGLLTSAVYDSNAGKVVVAYRDQGNSNYGTACVLTISGTSISLGTEVVFNSGNTQDTIATAFDSDRNEVGIFWQSTEVNDAGYSNAGTVSGTSISFPTGASPFTATSGVEVQNISATYATNSNQYIVVFEDRTDSGKGKYVIGTSDGASASPSINFTTAANFDSGNTDFISSVYDPDQNTTVITYKDEGNSGYGTAIGLQMVGATTNFTIGSTYYVQDDGTLSTTSSSVTAGKAIANTTLLLKG